MHLGVVDIGTNSVHLLVVRVDGDLKFHVIDRAKEMVRLGDKVFETGRIDEAAQRRTLEALAAFRRLSERRGVEHYIAVATSAVREAENGGAFLQDVFERTGIHPRIITGAEEARLVFRAVQSIVPADERPVVVLDLGGGSAEIARGTAREFGWSVSLSLGVQRLEALAVRRGEPTPETRRALKARLARDLAPLSERMTALKDARCYVTSGSGGATLKLLRARGAVGSDDTHLPLEGLIQLDDELSELPRKKRVALSGMEAERVDLIVGAVAFLREFVERFDLKRLEVSDRGLREGLVLDYLDRHGNEVQWETLEPNARRRAVLRLAERYHYDAAHAHHVAHLAVSLFDSTQRLHELGEAARERLEYAALLHDVGYVVAERAHHKHSEYLILHGLLGAFSQDEVRRIAAVARYHRKALPKLSHVNWSRLDPTGREEVRRLAALLRIADGLDRGHLRAVTGVQVRLLKKAVRLTVLTAEPANLEIWAATRKANLFQEVFGLEALMETAKGRMRSNGRGGARHVVQRRRTRAA